MRYAVILVALLATGSSACMVQTSQGTFDCFGEPVAGVVTVHCYPVISTSRPQQMFVSLWVIGIVFVVFAVMAAHIDKLERERDHDDDTSVE